MDKTRLRLVRPDERGALIGLQRRASLALDDYREQLQTNPDAIDLPAEQISGGEVVVAEVGGEVANPTARVFYERCGFRVEGETQIRFGPALAMLR